MKHFIYTILIFSAFLARVNLGAQTMVNVDCPDITDCLDGELVINDMTPWIDLPIAQVPNCGSVLWSQMNLKFQAKSKSLSLDLAFSSPGDPTFKLGIANGCLPYGTCVAFENCEFGNFPSIDVDDLVVGHEYIIFVDECGYETPFELVITPGSDDPFEAIIDINLDFKDCSFTPPIPNQFCAGTPIEWTFELEDESLYNSFSRQEATYHVSIDGPKVFEFEVDNYRDFSFQSFTPGDYILCLESVDFPCESYDIGICKEFSIEDWHHDYGLFEVCQNDLEQGWVPDSDWVGEEINGEGLFDGEYMFECGCPYYESIEVVQLNEVVEEVVFELCPEDYPFVYFDDYEFDYSQFDIEENLEIFRESLQRDYNNEKCDSLVFLILINEDPEDRCSSCELPVSLEKSKIVYCIPFDNDVVDVSGKRNIVEAVGVGFDDNGSSNNILWEAIFDGDGDYVSMPHIDDLNTSVFSFNFQFNKDEPFENGDIETIISKGDLNDGNLRFDLSLEKVNLSIFDLKANFYTANGKVEVVMPDLQIFDWYDIACVVETDTISIYLDGLIYSKTPVSENLKGNSDDLYIGTLVNNNSRTQYYNGRFDNFKYWKQKLSGQDVLFLHFPEKEFEVEQSYFLSCCEQAEFRDITIDINNQLDSLVIPGASPTGYDSVYILNYIQADSGPVLNTSIAPQDIVVQYQQDCQEFCQATVNWNTDLNNLFTNNCGNVQVSRSHDFDVELDENVSFVEVTLTGTDNCGQSTLHTFGLELECLPSDVIAVPEQNVFDVLVDDTCINTDEEICLFSDINLQFGFIDPISNSMQSYESDSDFGAVINVNGVEQTLNSEQILNGFLLNNFTSAGSYEVCLESVNNTCETIQNKYCQTINLRESQIVDHGQVVSCRNDIESSLPTEMSLELRNLILSNPQETTISISEQDNCGCLLTEKIDLAINESVEEDVFIELCEGDIYDGRTEDDTFTIHLLTSEGCDSLIHVNLMFNLKSEVMVFAEICEGDSYEGYTEEGTYVEQFVNNEGCDSTLTLQLTVLPKSYQDVFVEICPDSMYMGYNQTGIYEILDTNVLGCDSITTLSLTFDKVSRQLDVSHLNEGVYFIQLESDLKTIAFKKLIKL